MRKAPPPPEAAWFPTPPGAELALSLTIPKATPSNNEIKGMHHSVYTQLRRTFQCLVKDALWTTNQQNYTTIATSWLRVKRYATSDGLDWDNAYGGLKPLLDCLVTLNPRNPSGLGIITDDNPRVMPFPPFIQQERCKKGEERTELHIYRLPTPTL